MSILQTIKRVLVRGPVFEVLQNTNGEWFVHERATNGQIKSVQETYASKYNATRAAKKKADETRYASWRVIKAAPAASSDQRQSGQANHEAGSKSPASGQTKPAA